MKFLTNDKRAVSNVVATVLLILLTLVAVSIIVAILIPFIRDNLNESTNCVNVIDKIEIVNSETCYEFSPSQKTKVRVRAGNIDLEEIFIIIEKDGEEVSYSVTENLIDGEINGGSPLKLPTSGGGERTYEFDFVAQETAVGVVQDGQKCGISEETAVNLCL